jgi:hypothetical protein
LGNFQAASSISLIMQYIPIERTPLVGRCSIFSLSRLVGQRIYIPVKRMRLVGRCSIFPSSGCDRLLPV